MVSMDSCFADSMKPQVFTIIISASAGYSTNCALPLSLPSMSSESTLFLEHPNETMPILIFVSIIIIYPVLGSAEVFVIVRPCPEYLPAL